MNPDNINAEELNTLTKEFYNKCAKYWNNSSEYEWAGWNLLDEYWKAGTTVLDLGCGSGRFGHFLGRNKQLEISAYTAVDASDFYINHVRANPVPTISTTVIQKDLFVDSWNDLPVSDIVVAFGLIHHLPDELRSHFFTELHSLLKSETTCILTTWQYLDNPRLTKKILPNHKLQQGGHDNILSWTVGQYGERYSHHWTIEEVVAVAQQYGLRATFLPAPTKAEHGLNNYFEIQKL